MRSNIFKFVYKRLKTVCLQKNNKNLSKTKNFHLPSKSISSFKIKKMQGNFLLIFSLLLFFSFAHKSKLQSTIESDSKFLSQLRTNKLGKIILGLSELATDNDYDALFEALDMLSNGLNEKIETQTNLLNSAKNIHDLAVETYESLIENLELTIADLQQNLNNNLNPELNQLYTDIATLQERVENIQQQIADATSLRNHEKNEYENRNKDISDGIDSIDEALELLNSLANDNGDKSVALIQTQKQNLLQIKNKLQKKLSHIRNSFEYKPIIEALTQITLSDEFVDQQTLHKVISLLNDIRDSLNQMLYDLQEQEETAIKDFENTIQNSNDDLNLSQRILSGDKEKNVELQG